jgi:hypothetical protein
MNGEEIGGLSKLHLEIYSRAGIGPDAWECRRARVERAESPD